MKNMFRRLRNNIGAVILIVILGLILMGATYVNLGPTSLIDGDMGLTAGHGYYIDGVLATHTQNTDIGTTSTTFQIDSGNSGPKVKNNAGTLEARNAADDAYVDFKALSYYGDGSNLTDVGAATATALTIDAKVNEVGGITKGQPVYFSGAVGELPQASLADNTVDGKTCVAGIASETKTDGQTILIRVGGQLDNVDTSSYSDGDCLYLSTAGSYSTTMPTSGAIIIVAGVEYSHASQGKLLLLINRTKDKGAPADTDLITRLGDNAGVNKMSIRDYANNEVASYDSDGEFLGLNIEKNKWDATQAPAAATDDVTLGYEVGSRWIDVTNDKEYVCLDNTDGAAVWTETTQSGGGGAFTDLTDTPANYTGQAGKYTKVNAGETALEFGTPAGGGDVTKVGTPADSQVVVWTGDGTIEGAATLTYDGANLQLTGDIGSTGTKITKGWFTDLLVVNTITGSVTGFTPASGSLTLSGADALTLTTTAATDVTLPTTGTLLANLLEDTTPEYGGPMDHNNERDTEVKTVEFNGLYDNGNSGATPTINWQNGNYQKIAVSENTLFTFSNAFIGTITLQITYSGAFTAGFNAGYTILEEGGTEVLFTETNGAVDILKVMYLGTANNYVVGLMADVKD